jgi:hypothetical protein
MKYFLLSLITTSAFANCNIEEQQEKQKLIQDVYTKGCTDSLYVIVDLGLYKESKSLSSNDVVNLVESKCKEKALLYMVEKGVCDGK